MDSNLTSTQSEQRSRIISQPEGLAQSIKAYAETRTKSSFARRILPRWLGQFAGQSILRVCPAAHREDPCAGCELRVLCRCAQEDFNAAARVERRVWIVLAACGALVIFYCIL